MQQQLKIKTYDPNDPQVNVKDFKFKGMRALKGKLRKAERILSIDDPDNPDEPINVHLRALTPDEEASLHRNLIPENSMKGIVSTLVEKTQDGETVDMEDLTDKIATAMTENTNEGDNERLLRKIQKAMISPKVTTAWLAGLNPVILELLSNTIDDLRYEQELWIVENAIDTTEA